MKKKKEKGQPLVDFVATSKEIVVREKKSSKAPNHDLGKILLALVAINNGKPENDSWRGKYRPNGAWIGKLTQPKKPNAQSKWQGKGKKPSGKETKGNATIYQEEKSYCPLQPQESNLSKEGPLITFYQLEKDGWSWYCLKKG